MTRQLLLAVLLLVTHAQASAGFQAKVLSTMGGVYLHRDNQSTMARERVELRLCDRVRTVKDSGASLLIGTSIVYLAEATQAKIDLRDGVPAVTVLQGQVRVVVTGAPGIYIATRNSQAYLGQGIVRVMSDRSGSRIAGIEGETQLLNLNGQQGIRLAAYFQDETPALQQGQEAVIPQDGTPAKIQDLEEFRERDEESPIEVDSLQNQAADAAEQQQLDNQPPDLQQQTNPQNDNQPPADNLRAGANTAGVTTAQNNVASSSISASFGGLSASFAGSASGGLFADANQSTFQGMRTDNGDPFPGNIHLLTSESRYSLAGVTLLDSEKMAIFGPTNNPTYYSVTESLPTGQVFTDFLTATEPGAMPIRIPGTDNYIVKFTQFGLPDAGIDSGAAAANNIGITGLVGDPPSAPTVFNATPTDDTRAGLNQGVTFALGEFRLRPDGDSVEFAVRLSDQDRLIVKDLGGDDALDQVTVNPNLDPDADFDDDPDVRFQPQAPTVKVPVNQALDTMNQDAPTRFSNLNTLRRAAATTIMADQLHDFARRTGQTRFVVDGRIIDISGYQK